MDLDDDSDNDSDYVPGQDGEDDEDQHAGDEKEIGIVSISRKRKSQSLWEELEKEEKQFVKTKIESSVGYIANKKAKANSKFSADNLAVLETVFGRREAAKMSGGDSSQNSNKKSKKSKNKNSVDVRKLAMETVKNLVKKTTVTEVRKFAGQEIR